MFLIIFNTIFLITLTPPLLVFLALLFLYRSVVYIILKVQYQDRFVGFLDGSDAIWSVENPTALSVINVLATIETNSITPNEDVMEMLKVLVQTRLSRSQHKKLFYNKLRKYGYYFWEKPEETCVPQDRVKWLENDDSNCDGSCDSISGDRFVRCLQRICNKPLSEDGWLTWQILVSKPCDKIKDLQFLNMEEGRCLVKVPVLFRIHHSVGDGASLIKFLLDNIADANLSKDLTPITVPAVPKNYLTIQMSFNDDSIQSNLNKHSTGAASSYTNFYTFPLSLTIIIQYVGLKIKFLQNFITNQLKNEIKKFLQIKWRKLRIALVNLYERVAEVGKNLMVVFSVPSVLINQAFQSMDNSALHGPNLTGEKIIAYWLEDEYYHSRDKALLAKVREIKLITGTRFEDVLLAALSSSIHKYFVRVKESPPKRISVILPGILNSLETNSNLGNHFTVGLLPLCISEINGQECGNPYENSKSFERLQEIATSYEIMKSRPDRLVNSWVMKYLSAILPEPCTRLFLKSYSTLIFSNLIGPLRVRIFGKTVENIFCCIPNRSTTGISCCLLSYDGKVNLSLVADQALIQHHSSLFQILDDTVSEIDNIYDTLTLSFFSRSFKRNSVTA